MIGARLGSYVLSRKIGEGGMGVVYLATHVQLGQEVAIKLLLPQFSRDADIVARFCNEARAATRINHPGIVKIFDFGTAEDGGAYFVMEKLDGESLADRLRRGRMPVADACRVTLQACRGPHKPARAYVRARPGWSR